MPHCPSALTGPYANVDAWEQHCRDLTSAVCTVCKFRIPWKRRNRPKVVEGVCEQCRSEGKELP